MSDEQQQIALCEAMGWKLIGLEHPIGSGNTAWSLECAGKFHNELPDCNSLDVLHEFEKKLDNNQHKHFRQILWRLTDDQDMDFNDVNARNYISATAPQRLEALLRVLNLWEE